ncbi:hypothetical protein AVEN_85881-1 [Araneus ventricosus]|uniref:Uncharacterized protein n=1 Tax=Araneus ventricosus TaxID=182803 RepID=A0A4Y2LLX4_ARAVE|nr:hypothetical protein AVEN_85881-1 [Araneus ventricosus]
MNFSPEAITQYCDAFDSLNMSTTFYISRSFYSFLKPEIGYLLYKAEVESHPIKEYMKSRRLVTFSRLSCNSLLQLTFLVVVEFPGTNMHTAPWVCDKAATSTSRSVRANYNS